MTKAAFYKGQRLHEDLQTWRMSSTADLGRLAGAYRLFGYVNPRSRNRYNELTVATAIRPAVATSTLDRQTAMLLQIAQEHEALVTLSETLGPVSWTQDDTQVAAVTSSHSADPVAQTVSIGAAGGAWVPTAGAYLLCRAPSGTAAASPGFVAVITGTGVGTVDFVVDEDIDSSWEVRAVQMHYPEMAYDTYNDGGPPAPSVDWIRTGPTMAYRFVGGSGALLTISPDDEVDLG